MHPSGLDSAYATSVARPFSHDLEASQAPTIIVLANRVRLTHWVVLGLRWLMSRKQYGPDGVFEFQLQAGLYSRLGALW